MPRWGEILKELKDYTGEKKESRFDFVRRKYLKELQQHTNRNTILYASNWIQNKNIPAGFISITDEDIEGFMEAASGLSGNLDLIILSPGGSAEVAEALVIYLRSNFNRIRVIIPYEAMSAATMLACSADEIVMGAHSFIGPIDPQMLVYKSSGIQFIPSQAIIDQFERAKRECIENPKNVGVWLPILEQYGPALIIQCEEAIKLSEELVEKWLKNYMFAGDEEAKKKSDEVAKKLSNHSKFLSHGRRIGREQAKEFGLKITNLEDDPDFQDLVLSVFYSTTFTFDATPATKIIENHLGHAFIRQFQQIPIRTAPSKTPKSK